jgi:hypothetical protein
MQNVHILELQWLPGTLDHLHMQCVLYNEKEILPNCLLSALKNILFLKHNCFFIKLLSYLNTLYDFL